MHSSALSVHKRNRFHKVSQYEREEYNMFSKSKAWNINYCCLPTRFQFLVFPIDGAKRFGSEWRVWILAGRFLFKRPPIRQKFERFCSKWNFTKCKESQNKTATGGKMITVLQSFNRFFKWLSEVLQLHPLQLFYSMSWGEWREEF